MTEQELITLLGQKFDKTGQIVSKDTEELADGTKLTHKIIAVFDIADDVLKRKWIHYYKDDKGNCYWQEKEPKPDVITECGFSCKVHKYVETKLSSGDWKWAEVEGGDDFGINRIKINVVDSAGIKKQIVLKLDSNDKIVEEVLQ